MKFTFYGAAIGSIKAYLTEAILAQGHTLEEPADYVLVTAYWKNLNLIEEAAAKGVGNKPIVVLYINVPTDKVIRDLFLTNKVYDMLSMPWSPERAALLIQALAQRNTVLYATSNYTSL